MPWWGTLLIGVGSAVLGVVTGCIACCKAVLHMCEIEEDDPRGKEAAEKWTDSRGSLSD